MELLYFFEKIRIPGLNEFMLAITTLGEETAFLVIALILFWCIDKYVGYYTLSVGFIGTIANQFLKLWFRIPRPWVLDENFTILEQAREGAGGYSFPSGHTQSAVGTFGSIAATAKHKRIRIACIVIAALVAISRMYIGVHTPLDVGVSVLVAAVLIFAVRPLVFKNRKVGMIENGSWAPLSSRVMQKMLENSKNLIFANTTVKIFSAVKEENVAEIEALAKELTE